MHEALNCQLLVQGQRQVPLPTSQRRSTQELEMEKESNAEVPEGLQTLKKRTGARVVPPLNFSLVEKQLYRSGQPAPINFPFLEELKLKTIIWLAVEDPSDEFLAFTDDREIVFHHLGLVTESSVGGSNPWDQLTETSIVEALNIVIDSSNYPLLICCGMGRHRTGTVVGCLRRLQGWNLASISDEYRRFTGTRGGRVLIELHIEAFDTNSIKIGEGAPEWAKRIAKDDRRDGKVGKE